MNLLKRAKSSLFLYIGIILILLGVSLNFFSHGKVLSTHTVSVKITPKVAKKNIPTSTTAQRIQAISSKSSSFPTNVPAATNTPVPQATNTPAPQPTSTPVPQTTVNMQISEPDGTNNFSLPVGGNACDELTEAKSEGKIRSVTFSDQYMSSMHSLYVTEMNGYQNNWTFTVNGQGPEGCSLSSPKAGDNVVWKFS